MMRKILIHVALPLVLLVVGVGCTGLIVAFGPSTERSEQPEKKTVVEFLDLVRQPHRVVVSSSGTVSPAQQVVVLPQVSGKLVSVADPVVPGGQVSKGDTLFRIDSRDYQIVVQQERARVAAAKLELAIEEQRGSIAEREWDLLNAGESATELALRRPQLVTSKASLQGAEAGLQRAELNLGRTAIRAPFNALVLSESGDVGQVVGPTSQLATLVGSDQFWVRVSVPVDVLPLLDVPGYGGSAGSPARVVQRLPDGSHERVATLLRLEGQLDPQTRTATLVVGVDDPLQAGEGGLPLLPGAYVDVHLDGQEREAVALPPGTVQDGRFVFLVGEGGRLERREVAVGWRTREQTFVTEGLASGDRLVVTPLSFPIEGMLLDPRSAGEEASDVAG